MAKPSGERDPDHWIEVFVCAWLLFSAATNLQGGQLRVRGNNDGDGTWRDLGDALAMPSTSGDMRISPNIDPEGQYNVRLVDQPLVLQEPVQNIDADNVAAAEADLNLWLTVAEVASLPRQIERDEANMMVRRPQVPSSVAASGMAPSSLVDDATVGAPQHLPPQSPLPEAVAADAPVPGVFGIPAGVLSQRIEDEDEAHAAAQVEVEVEVAIEDSPPAMLELISGVDVTRRPQFAAASVTVPAGGLESTLEEHMPVLHPEAGDSSADLNIHQQADVNIQDDDENLEVKEPHALGMQ